MRGVIVTGLLTLAARGASAQGNYEIEVYSTEIAPVKSLMLELHSNYTLRGRDVTATNGKPPQIDDSWRPADFTLSAAAAAGCPTGPVRFLQTNPAGGAALDGRANAFAVAAAACSTASNSYATHESIEATTGLNSWSEVGAYVFTSEQDSPGVSIIGGSVRAKVRAPLTWNWPVGIALSTELEYDNPAYSTDTWSWELRPVIEKAAGRWYFSVNPTLERTLQGTGVANGVQFSPSAKTDFDFTDRISGGFEYYGAFGKIGGFAPPDSRLQQFFGAVDLRVSPLWEINFGLGAGVTPATNHLMAKLILGRRFFWN